MSAPHDILQVGAEQLETQTRFLRAFEIETPLLSTWTLWQVADASLPPRTVGLAERDGAIVVPEFDDGFARLVNVEPVNLPDEASAISYVRLFLEMTRRTLLVRESLADVAGLNTGVAESLMTDIVPPTAARQGTGWEVTAFLLEEGNLKRGLFTIDVSGHVASELELIVESLSIFTE